MKEHAKFDDPLEIDLSECVSVPVKRKWKRGGIIPYLVTGKKFLFKGKFRQIYMTFSSYFIFYGKSKIEIVFK